MTEVGTSYRVTIRRPFSLMTRIDGVGLTVLPNTRGCPPLPEQLIHAIMQLQEKIGRSNGSFRQALNLG